MADAIDDPRQASRFCAAYDLAAVPPQQKLGLA
jgi:hypothetical protein